MICNATGHRRCSFKPLVVDRPASQCCMSRSRENAKKLSFSKRLVITLLADNGITTVRNYFNTFCESRPLQIRRAFDPDPGAIPRQVISGAYRIEGLRRRTCNRAVIVSVDVDGIGVMFQIDVTSIQRVVVDQKNMELSTDARRPAIVQVPNRHPFRLFQTRPERMNARMKFVVEVPITVRGTLNSCTGGQIENVYPVAGMERVLVTSHDVQ